MTGDPQAPPNPEPSPSPWRSAAWAARAVQVRLRFVLVLAAAALVVGRWETLQTYWDRAARAARGGRTDLPSVSNDTEYFCPMDPGVVADWPGRCGVCNMALVRRKKGEAAPLPSGVVARMQLSPYRVQLAGVRTAPASYAPLEKDVALAGRMTGAATAEADAFAGDLPYLADGLPAEVTSDLLPGRKAVPAKVVGLDGSRVRLTLGGEPGGLRPGMAITARVRRPVSELDPFRSLPSDPPPLRKGEPRAAYVCPVHPEILRDTPDKCPKDPADGLVAQPLRADQRLDWWCPMHPKVAADRPGRTCGECGGMVLVPRVVTYRPAGQVLAVPESAVVDTGARRVVYVERMAGTFDGVEVVLGPRCGDRFPVVSGLEPGDRVAVSGAFLLDAETRLNPSLAAAYFGAGRGPREPAPVPAPSSAAPAPAALCPVTGKPLGSMGPPVTVVVNGRAVKLCCEGCEDRLRKDPEKYLAKKP